jgi:hypothetical protein
MKRRTLSLTSLLVAVSVATATPVAAAVPTPANGTTRETKQDG